LQHVVVRAHAAADPPQSVVSAALFFSMPLDASQVTALHFAFASQQFVSNVSAFVPLSVAHLDVPTWRLALQV
jgi:hypothetical protein